MLDIGSPLIFNKYFGSTPKPTLPSQCIRCIKVYLKYKEKNEKIENEYTIGQLSKKVILRTMQRLYRPIYCDLHWRVRLSVWSIYTADNQNGFQHDVKLLGTSLTPMRRCQCHGVLNLLCYCHWNQDVCVSGFRAGK